MKIKIVKIGEDSKDIFVQSAKEYLQRIHKPFQAEIISAQENKRLKNSADAVVKDQEGKTLLQLAAGHYLVAMHETGKLISSVNFANFLEEKSTNGQKVAFLIGGPTGLSDEVLKTCHMQLSLSPMTFPHRMALCMLSEQIYRATEILRGGPYHKA